MGWYRALPDPERSGIKATGIPGLYCNNSAAPSHGRGIGTQSRRAKRAKWQTQYMANRQARSMLYAARGSTGATEWHSKLDALSRGTL